MADATDFLLTVHEQHVDQARWHEAQREKISTLVLIGGGALLAFAGEADPWQRRIIFLAITLLGLLGILLAFKHYERNRKHAGIARSLRERLGQLLPEAEMTPTLGAAPIHDNRACRVVEPVRLYVLWLLLMSLVACLGLGLLLVDLHSA